MAFVTTDTPLDADGAWTSEVLLSGRDDYISGSVFSDQAGTIYIEQSGDGENWDISTFYETTANDGKGFSEPLYLPLTRIRFVNGSTDQTAFRIFARFTSAGDS